MTLTEILQIALTPTTCGCIEGIGRTKSKAKDIGRTLREAREKARVTVEDMSEKIGKPQQYLRDMEAGRRNWSLKAIQVYLKEFGHQAKDDYDT